VTSDLVADVIELRSPIADPGVRGTSLIASATRRSGFCSLGIAMSADSFAVEPSCCLPPIASARAAPRAVTRVTWRSSSASLSK
jgi:hypothetical protein